uniref:non-specific serine/threonine protein kinase n=1 Tax=Fagus sylvatica TaxID=28930 RepID=A0A2N9G6N0_FAGSY
MATLLGLLASALVIRIYKKRKLGLDSTWELTPFQQLNFTESAILLGLTENNVISSSGSGKVYRVVVNSPHDIVAVKWIWNNRKLEQKLEKNFLQKKIKASTTSSSVHHVVLEWPKRLQIAVGAAQGLYYMHHGCSPPIVHRDVKSSNILLDSEFNAKIADFGLAKMLIKRGEGELATMSAMAGSFGYIAPIFALRNQKNQLNVQMTKTAPTFIQFSFYTFFLFFLFFTHAYSQLIDQEQTVLLKLKQHWQNPPALSHWNPLNSSHYCNWPEITCTNGSLTQLRLPNMNITGTFPPFICDLKNLTLFDLSNNNIFNEFPKALYNCSKLEDLDLSQNYFNAQSRLTFTACLACAASTLEPTAFLAPSQHLLDTAVLPSSFTKLKKLTYLWMTASNLNGEIPDTIGEMEALVHLDLAKNSLSGKIPSSLFMPKNLSIVYLYKTNCLGRFLGWLKL